MDRDDCAKKGVFSSSVQEELATISDTLDIAKIIIATRVATNESFRQRISLFLADAVESLISISELFSGDTEIYKALDVLFYYLTCILLS